MTNGRVEVITSVQRRRRWSSAEKGQLVAASLEPGASVSSIRAEATIEFQGNQVFKGGENSIVVYAINQTTGAPQVIQHIETQKIHPRTFHIDPSGRLLVAQHNLPVNVRDGDTVKTIPAGLSVFRMADHGKLTLVRKYDVDVGDKTMFWMGMVPL